MQLTIGLILLLVSGLAMVWNPLFMLATIMLGAGLTVAGATGFCGLARLLALAPCNK